METSVGFDNENVKNKVDRCQIIIIRYFVFIIFSAVDGD